MFNFLYRLDFCNHSYKSQSEHRAVLRLLGPASFVSSARGRGEGKRR